MTTDEIGVLIADDQHMVRAGLAALLAAEDGIEVVGEAGDGAEALAYARDRRPDVVLMDVRMPVMDGLTATRRLLETDAPAGPGGPPRVIMLTTFDLDEYVYTALRAGASGFMLKHAPPAELTRAVRIAAAGDALIAPEILRRMVEDFVRVRPAQPPRPVVDELTQRETEVLTLVARGLSNTEIADRLVVAEQTVKTHLGRVFAKLGLRDRAQAVIYAYETGLVTVGGGER